MPNLFNERLQMIRTKALEQGLSALGNDEITLLVTRPIVRRGVGPVKELVCGELTECRFNPVRLYFGADPDFVADTAKEED